MEYKTQKINVIEPSIQEVTIALTDVDSISIRRHLDVDDNVVYRIMNEMLFCMDENGNFGTDADAKIFKSIDEAKGCFWYFYGEPTVVFGKI